MLDDADLELIAERRGDHNRLGFALQAATVRYLGMFLEDPLEVPWPVVEYLAGQLGIADASCVKRYTDRPKTAYEHAWEIRQAYGYRAVRGRARRRRRSGRSWTAGPGRMPRDRAALFGQAVSWLRRNRVLLPGVSVLTRLVSQVRDAAAERLYAHAGRGRDLGRSRCCPRGFTGCCRCRDRASVSRSWSGCGVAAAHVGPGDGHGRWTGSDELAWDRRRAAWM